MIEPLLYLNIVHILQTDNPHINEFFYPKINFAKLSKLMPCINKLYLLQISAWNRHFFVRDSTRVPSWGHSVSSEILVFLSNFIHCYRCLEANQSRRGDSGRFGPFRRQNSSRRAASASAPLLANHVADRNLPSQPIPGWTFFLLPLLDLVLALSGSPKWHNLKFPILNRPCKYFLG